MIVVRFLQFLAAMFLVRLVLRAIGAMVRSMQRREQPGPAGGVAQLVRDPICNVHLPRERALTAKVEGQTEYFCSDKCRDEALHRVRRAS